MDDEESVSDDEFLMAYRRWVGYFGENLSFWTWLNLPQDFMVRDPNNLPREQANKIKLLTSPHFKTVLAAIKARNHEGGS